MSETVIPVASIEPDGTLVFYRPIKVGNLEIEPSRGGVLEDGVPYQTNGGPGVEVPLSTIYRYVSIPVPDNWVMGSSVVSTAVRLDEGPRFAVMLRTFFGQIQPDPVNGLVDYTVIVTVENIPNLATFANGMYVYSNLYNGSDARVVINSITPVSPISADVNLTCIFSVFMGQTGPWVKPGDCIFFMEFY